MRTAIRCVTAGLLVSGAMLAHAAGPLAEICYSPELSALASVPPGNGTRFECSLAGSRTLAELAQLGYRIVRLTPTTGVAPSTIRSQLVVQLQLRIHASGFE